MDHTDAPASQTGRLKRVRTSNVSLRDSFQHAGNDIDSRVTPDPSELDADLQNSIRAQDAGAFKRPRLSPEHTSASPFVNRRRSRFIERSMKDEASQPPPSDFTTPGSSGFSLAFRNAFTPMWSGMTGMFGRRNAREMAASSTSTDPASLPTSGLKPLAGSRFDFQDAPRTHSSQSNNSSARDSGIYFFGDRHSTEQKHSFAMTEAPATSLRAALNHSPTMTPARNETAQAEISPLKRLLHRASMSSLKKVRSHFALSSARKAVPPADDQLAPVPAVPTIPDQFLKPEYSALKPERTRDDLKKEAKLNRKISNLQAQLDQAMQERADLYGQPKEPVNPNQPSAKAKPTLKKMDANTNAEPTRALPLPPFSGYSRAPSVPEPMHATIEWTNGFSPSKDNAKLTALPSLPGPPIKSQKPIEIVQPVEPLESVEPTQVIEPGTLFGTHGAFYRESAENTVDWELERNRRSLSTIMSSRAASPEPLSEVNLLEPKNPKRSSGLRSQAIQEDAKTKQENIPFENAANASKGAPSKPSRIPLNSLKNSPRKRSSNNASDLPVINAIRSPPRHADNRIGSPRKRSETDGVHKKRRPQRKKSVGGTESGHFDDDGVWVWNEEEVF